MWRPCSQLVNFVGEPPGARGMIDWTGAAPVVLVMILMTRLKEQWLPRAARPLLAFCERVVTVRGVALPRALMPNARAPEKGGRGGGDRNEGLQVVGLQGPGGRGSAGEPYGRDSPENGSHICGSSQSAAHAARHLLTIEPGGHVAPTSAASSPRGAKIPEPSPLAAHSSRAVEATAAETRDPHCGARARAPGLSPRREPGYPLASLGAAVGWGEIGGDI
ncbi:unnamed protein product [Lampetra planeri]